MPALWILPAALALLTAGSMLAPSVVERALLGVVAGGVLTVLAGIIGYVLYALTALALRVDATLSVAAAALMCAALVAAGQHRVAPRPPDERADGDGGGGGGLHRPDPERPRDPGPAGDLGPDWDGFDAARRAWEDERAGDRVPALLT
ncbi:hypothetical protein NBH00_15890 [Paraconexibacter antarcticus]|uniref:Uncharacterized protein n=1 Tax=Paraconexibacter antarcticus TaxID=2949664 RepID=A0ABY5DPX2_9ACTN|nr:hypothetical protein [Paraconexibacter antarcticus]UTI62837.1 hypothetical protein NBH00_15890 [Paraconexibacter antarcticus]